MAALRSALAVYPDPFAALAARGRSWMGLNVYRLIVPATSVGYLIGHDGWFVKRILHETGARVRVLDAPVGVSDRIVLISAKEDRDVPAPPAMDAAIRVFWRLNNLSEAHGSAAMAAPACSVKLLVALYHALSLIPDSSDPVTKVILDHLPPLVSSDERVIELHGETQEVLERFEEILAYLRKFPVDQSKLPPFEQKKFIGVKASAPAVRSYDTKGAGYGSCFSSFAGDAGSFRGYRSGLEGYSRCRSLTMAVAEGGKFQKEFLTDKFFPSPTTVLKKLYQEEPEDDYYLEMPSMGKRVRTTVDFSKGARLNIVDLLSNHGKRTHLVNKKGNCVPVDYLKDKCVVLCCIPVPVPNNDHAAAYCRAVITACSSGDFVIVIAAKMSSDFDREDVFNHFFSGFPEEALAIPFCDDVSRVCLFDSLYHTGSHSLYTLVVDRQGLILQTDNAYDFYKYGSELFPFTDEHLNDLKEADQILRLAWVQNFDFDTEQMSSTPFPSLTSLLGCKTLSKINDAKAFRTVSELRDKVVGIYLVKTGTYLNHFHRFQQLCLQCDPDFVMVVVCICLEEEQSSFLHHISLALKMRNINSWWLSPSDDKTRRRLCRMTFCCQDELFIVPPGGKMAELEGRYVSEIDEFNVPDYYPFTRETILMKRLDRLKSLTIESLLKDFTHLARGGMKTNLGASLDVPVAHLRGKKIILYLDCTFSDPSIYDLLLSHYSDIQREHINSEVVFLPLGSKCPMVPAEMPWLMLPFPSDYVVDQLLRDYDRPHDDSLLIAFGEDGKILSRETVEYLREHDIANLFNDTLRQEIVALLSNLESNYDCY